MNLHEKVVLITGASSGIGKATAVLFSKYGANVCFSYKENTSGAEHVLAEVKKNGVQALSVQADITRDEEVKRLVSHTISTFGKIDILVNNAGRYIAGDEWNGDIEVWEQSFKQNFISAVTVSKYVLEHMQQRHQGSIVNIASRYSVSGQFDAPIYAAAKAGIANLTQGQAKLMAPWGRSNAVSPGAVHAGYWLRATKEELQANIDVTPLGKLVEPEDIAQAVIFLASDSARMITGQNLIVDGGYTLK